MDYPAILQLASQRPQSCRLKGVTQSSHDFNQSVYMTLENNQTEFWSSGGSLTQDANEFLIYELPHKMRVNGVSIRSFDPKNFQLVNSPYAPRMVQFFVSDDSSNFISASPQLPYDTKTYDTQYFSLEPHLVIGKFLKVLLIGKLKKQQMDQKYYHAISYVGATTTEVSDALGQLTVPPSERPILDLESVRKAVEGRDEDFFFNERHSVRHHLAELLSGEDSESNSKVALNLQFLVQSVIREYNYLHSEVCHLILDLFEFMHRQSVSQATHSMMRQFANMLVRNFDTSLGVEHSQPVLDRIAELKSRPGMPEQSRKMFSVINYIFSNDSIGMCVLEIEDLLRSNDSHELSEQHYIEKYYRASLIAVYNLRRFNKLADTQSVLRVFNSLAQIDPDNKPMIVMVLTATRELRDIPEFWQILMSE